MAFSKDVDNITVDGSAVVWIKPTGGSLSDIGFVSGVAAEAIPIKRETTIGDPSVGFDLRGAANMCQTLTADWAAAVDAIDCEQFKIVGSRTNFTINSVYLSVGLKATYSNKSESEINIEALKKGVTLTAAKAALTDAS